MSSTMNITPAERTSLDEYRRNARNKKTYTVSTAGEPTFEGLITEVPR
jgi:hypothetical protein